MSQIDGASVTVVIPAYRAAETIARTLESIAGQTVAPARAIVVMDGYDDELAAKIDECRPRLGDIELTVLCQDHQGAGAARNRAIDEVNTEFVAFLDADDEWLPNKIARTISALATPSVVLACHEMIVVDRDAEQRTDSARHLPHDADAFIALFKRGFVATSTVLARTAAIRECGGFDTSLSAGQDYELWLRVANRFHGGISVVTEPLTRYNVLPGSITSAVWRRRSCALRIAARHAPEVARRAHGAFRVLVTRVAIISYEAAVGHWRRGNRIAAIQALSMFPLALIDVLRGEDRIERTERRT